MLGTLAITDTGWYEFLRNRQPAEVNFWTPSDRRRFNAPALSPFLFKLKAPANAICGFGYFARWSSLPDWLAWDAFGVGNGAVSFREMRARIDSIRARIRYVPDGPLSNIGCIIIVQPTFFPPDAVVPQPRDWPARTVSSKAYDLTQGEGARVWSACLERVATFAKTGAAVVAEPGARYGLPRTITPRLGQGAFRVAVTDAYERACAVTGEHSLPALDAAHIRPFGDDGPHAVENGILLRADLHRLFDQGYVTVSPGHRLEVSARLRADYSNGRSYYPLDGSPVRVPSSARDRPSVEHLRWHNEHVFRA